MGSANGGAGSRLEAAAGPETLEAGDLESGAAWRERLEALEAENARLQALICYLLRANEELRLKSGLLG